MPGLLMFPNLKCHKEDKVFFDEEGVSVFISKNCWNMILVRNLLVTNCYLLSLPNRL